MDSNTVAKVGELAKHRPFFPMARVLTCWAIAAAMALVLTAGQVRAGTSKNENVVTLGIMQAPILKPPAAGIYISLLIFLEVADDIDRRSVTRHLARLRDTVMLDLHQNPFPPNHKDGPVDVAAIEHRLLDKVTRVVGSRMVERVRVYEVTKNQVCDKDAPVGVWSNGCLQK